MIGDLVETVHAEFVHQAAQAPASDVVAGGQRIEIACHLHRLADIGPHDVEHALVGLAAVEHAHDRDAKPFLEHLAGVRPETGTADVDDMDGRGEQPRRRAVAEARRHHREVEQVSGGEPGVVGDVDVALAHGVGRELLEKERDRRGHRVDMARRAGDRLGEHAAPQVEDPGREVAGLAHGGRERRADDRLGLLLDDGDQPIPQHLVAQPGGEAGRGRALAPQHQVAAAVDAAAPARRNDRGGLGLRDGGGSRDGLAGAKPPAREDVGAAGALMAGKHDVAALLARRVARIRGAVGPVRPGRGPGGADRDRPGQGLDLEAGHGLAELPTVDRLEVPGDQGLVAGSERAVGQVDLHLVALADIARPGVAAFDERTRGRAHGHDLARFRAHPVEQVVERVRLEPRHGHVEAVHHLVGDRGEQEPDRRADAGVGRNHHPGDVEFLGEPGGMKRRGAAEGDHGAVPDLGSPLDGVDARRRGHVLVDDLDHAQGGRARVAGQRGADMALERRGRGMRVEVEGAAREGVRRQPAQRQVGVGHGGPRAAARVAGRAGIGARALRADLDAPEMVDRGEGSAARADLDHLDHRDLQRRAASLHEAVGAVDLERAAEKRLAVVEQADLRGGAAHVETDDPAFAHAFRHVSGKDRAARRSGLDQPHRKRRGGSDGDKAAARGHQQAGAGKPGVGETRLHVPQIAAHDRLDVGVGDGRGLALVFADLRTDLRRQRHRHRREPFAHDGADALLVGGVGIGVEQPHRDASHAGPLQRVEPCGDGGLVERGEHVAARRDAFRDGQAQLPGHERRAPVGHDVVLVEAVLVGDLQRVAVAPGHEQRRHGAFALDYRVGRQRGAVQDETDVAGRDPGALQDLHDAVHEPVGRRVGGREHLAGGLLAGAVENDVGEGAADIDGQAYLHDHSRNSPQPGPGGPAR